MHPRWRYSHPQLTLEDAGTPVNTPNKQQEIELKHTSSSLDYRPQGRGRRACKREKTKNRGRSIIFSFGEMEDIEKAKKPEKREENKGVEWAERARP